MPYVTPNQWEKLASVAMNLLAVSTITFLGNDPTSTEELSCRHFLKTVEYVANATSVSSVAVLSANVLRT